MKNLFCNDTDLRNEASVESLFVDRLLNALNYPDNRVRRKESIEEIVIGRGRKKEKYKPDYVLLDSNSIPIVVLDAKNPDENPEDFHYQVSSYALYLNQKYSDRNPVLYTILTNGHIFLVYPWDSDRPVFFLRFEDFVDGNENFLDLRSNLSFSAFNQVAATKGIFDFHRPSITTLIGTFTDCHNLIWKKEKISPTDAFYEFAKIMFIKIREDNRIHSIINGGNKPKLDDFIFSTDWIEKQSKVEKNPFDKILFRQIQDELEHQIKEKTKKRIFEKGEILNLKSSTTYEVVKKLQNFDLYGIDEDLNGRMFETFLNATVRGRDLGQFFTPRSIVHYMVETASFFISTDKKIRFSDRSPYIFDGCCGSGGFLIDAMANFIQQINRLSHLTDKQRKKYIDEIKNNHLYGIDANPKISKIARLNMYLHGDGGSKIFRADTLDKIFQSESGMSEEEIDGLKELKKYIIEENLHFDVVLTNPPFSMKYKQSDKHEKRILEQYKIARTSSGQISNSEKSNVLFLERYMDLLKPEKGELLTIIDDTVLNGDLSQKYRDFILKNFVIIQIISLPYNTFFRAGANIKTSMIHLRRKSPDEKQGSIFMAITNNIGHDDHCRDTPERNNLHQVAKCFEEWQKTGKIKEMIINNEDPLEPLSCPLQIFEVPIKKINPQRLDAFYYSPELNHARERLLKLEKKGKIIIKRGNEFKIIPELTKFEIKNFKGKIFKYFEIGNVTRDGTIVVYREDPFEDLPTRARIMVKKNDVVFAKNNSSRGTTVIIPDWFDGGLVTTGFIGIRPKDYEESLILWNLFESEFFRKQVYYLAITASQPEVRDNIFKAEMLIPWPKSKEDREKIIENAEIAEKSRNQLKNSLDTATEIVKDLLILTPKSR
jgi:type I restriction enzyme M protein